MPSVKLIKTLAISKRERRGSLEISQKVLASSYHEEVINYTVPLGRFLSRSWISRSWIVREYALGCQSSLVFKCGSLKPSRGDVGAVSYLVSK